MIRIGQYHLVLVVFVSSAWGQTGPSFCSYNDGVFECDYASMVSTSDRPIDYNGFSEDPQQIELTVNGFLPYFGDSQVFANFDSLDVTQFDSNYPAALTIDCGFGGSMFMTAGAFSNMSHVQYLKIRNCETFYIPSQMFTELVNLDYFSFESGSIDDIDPNGMFGLTVEKLHFQQHTFPRNLGRFEVKYSPFSTKSVPPGLLFNWKNLSTVALVGADLETVSADAFTFNTKLTSIDISDNLFTSIPTGIFDNLNSLSEVVIYNTDWTCSCADTWFVSYSASNNFTMYGDYMCSNVAGSSVWKYYFDNCATEDVCEGIIEWTYIPIFLSPAATSGDRAPRETPLRARRKWPEDNHQTISFPTLWDLRTSNHRVLPPFRQTQSEEESVAPNCKRIEHQTCGIGVMGKCLGIFAMIVYGLAFSALIMAIVCLVLIVTARKQEIEKRNRRTRAIGGWNKIIDMGLKKKGGKA